jgi:D-beta-D-heptose 7-phosphate kinase/D-beta-D-heptose 1-phosphate adenosyltransferase
MNTARLQQILSRFTRLRVLVVGDVMLDHFIWGKVHRISPEAPLPVVEVTRESHFPGGAANVSRNLRSLNADVVTLGLVGDDAAGETLRELLAGQGLQTRGLLTDADRPTTVKVRVIAQHQQVVRYDREKVLPPSPAMKALLLGQFARALDEVQAVVFEDYAKGLLSQPLLDQMHRQARRRGLVTTADPNSRHLLRYRQLTAVTPNRAEAFAAAGLPYAEPATEVLRDEALRAVGAALLRKWQPANLLITLGEDGMCLFRPGKKPHHIPTVAQEVFDVSGAGDTAIATLTLALAAKASPVEAAELANHAAGIVVGKLGTATCSAAELRDSFRRHTRDR